MDIDISMDIHAKTVDMDMDMDGIFHIHGKPGLYSWWTGFAESATVLLITPSLDTLAPSAL